ncbi:class II fumarate hydratase [Parasphingorhabdus halotolerans]|uniref:Fumarate hydratase class II n=1 Tax=Parasphingorhabdus halotolerans TaxID=2725558 RepID=A0A6H2DL19_9SPHN|nr:class II fumarate hydratase [Parasphingorhabdus halotolerans]QJB68837.1 class II fumarate hydratase [Parasphingorhabdus halotolerans]
MTKTRTEADSLGNIEVPAEAYWGAQTQRSIDNFPFPRQERMPIRLIHALATVKQAAARVNGIHGLEAEISAAIEKASKAVRSGEYDNQFPLTIWQTGSGTQTNMNVNEVIAGIANESIYGTRGGKYPVHPNDHVNRGQSSNDSFPTAMHVASALALEVELFPALEQLHDALAEKAQAWKSIVKIGRTHLQDATPLTLGQEFSGYTAQLVANRDRIEAVLPRLHQLAQGGTAVGTGLNAPENFGEHIAREISKITGLKFTSAPNKFAELAAHDTMVELSGALSTLAVSLTKIANDIRLLGSGPRSGLGELSLPANEPGSSIMPGKVNPTQCEMLTMVAAQMIGNHQAVTVGGLQGHLELNVFKPLIGANVLRSIEIASIGMSSFATRCVDGLEPNEQRIGHLVDNSLMLITALAPIIGYDKSSKIAKHAHDKGITLKAAALELGLVDEATYNKYVRPEAMTGPRT